jgi:putative membrane protein
MIVNQRGSMLRMLAWQWRSSLLFLATGAAAVLVHDRVGWTWAVIPALPTSIAGSALAFFVSFRTNNAYERWWEGRKLWGQLVNASRTFASQAHAYLPHEEADRIVRRHLAFVHWLRCALRDQPPKADPELARFGGEVPDAPSPGVVLLHEQLTRLAALATEGKLPEHRLQSLERSLAAFHDVQGGCERLKRTPLPRAYAFMAERFTVVFGFLFPFALVNDLGWGTPVANLLVCIGFTLISESGRVLEDPFTLFWNGLPLSALSRNIEIQLLHLGGERNLPPPIALDEDGVLM